MSMTYEETLRFGADWYGDVLLTLKARRLPARFIQTGGMSAAILVVLEADHYLLIADQEESLAWDRFSRKGLYVGMYQDVEAMSTAPIHWGETAECDVPRCSPVLMAF